jgi:uncharacterized membrane protein
LEAFSDGVIAILITIMVLELKTPEETNWSALRPMIPVFGTYILSFVHLGIYWNNHHHMLQATQKVSGGVLWANLHLLFWLSLLPFGTSWMGEHDFAQVPTAAYGIVLLGSAISYYVLQQCILRVQDDDAVLRKALGSDLKGRLSPVLYALGIATSFLNRWVGLAFYVTVAVIWLVPDRRIESEISRPAP